MLCGGGGIVNEKWTMEKWEGESIFTVTSALFGIFFKPRSHAELPSLKSDVGLLLNN